MEDPTQVAGETATNQTSGTDGNGATKVTSPASTTKMVPERDLLAVKTGAEKAKEEYEKSLNQARQELNDANQEIARHRAASEQLEETVKQLRDSAIPQEKLDALTKERDDALLSVEQTKNKVLELRRQNVVMKHKVPEDKVANKSLAELDMFEEALAAVGAGKREGNYISGGTGGAVPASKLDEAKRELDAVRQRAAKRQSGTLED